MKDRPNVPYIWIRSWMKFSEGCGTLFKHKYQHDGGKPEDAKSELEEIEILRRMRRINESRVVP